MSRRRIANHVRPTREGVGYIGVTLAILFAAINTGNNLLYMILACLMGILLVANLLAEWNLRGLRIERQMPSELFAQQPARGRIIIHNSRRMGTAWTLLVTDRVQGVREPVAQGRMLRIPPGEKRNLFLSWSFHNRGDAMLRKIRVESSFPFGLVLRWRELDEPIDLLVYPAPALSILSPSTAGMSQGNNAPQKQSRTGELKGMREYVPGDPLRDVHWPTSARTNTPMIRMRNGHESSLALVTVDPTKPREEAISQATGSVLQYLSEGVAVGLSLDGNTHPPRIGSRWRHHLLQLLARAPTNNP